MTQLHPSPISVNPNVWIAHLTRSFDYTPATRYGKLQVINFVEHPSDDELQYAVGLFREAFDPLKDYLILTGSPVVMSAAMLVAVPMAVEAGQKVRLLQFDKVRKAYDLVQHDLTRLWRP